jgi:hypothetical protein
MSQITKMIPNHLIVQYRGQINSNKKFSGFLEFYFNGYNLFIEKFQFENEMKNYEPIMC